MWTLKQHQEFKWERLQYLKLYGLDKLICVVRAYIESHIEYLLGETSYVNDYEESQL